MRSDIAHTHTHTHTHSLTHSLTHTHTHTHTQAILDSPCTLLVPEYTGPALSVLNYILAADPDWPAFVGTSTYKAYIKGIWSKYKAYIQGIWSTYKAYILGCGARIRRIYKAYKVMHIRI